ncbi:hypothetical protein CCMA1212_008706 [Trichoderma ghanense]|uniref:Uncharacterized protein n=1 Tax=Trichoderma ghanense TaxID=65468 RepID=A0ABY2GX45_9HYPO
MPSKSTTTTPKSLLPTLSTSLNVGMALGAWITVLPFANPAYPGPAVAIWFRDFFKPGFIGITSLSAVTVASGIRAAWNKPQPGLSAEGQAKAKKASRWAIAGLVFTLVHFGFGNSVLAIMDKILSAPELAQGQMAGWIRLHTVRTLTTDVPAWLCFVAALLSELSFSQAIKSHQWRAQAPKQIVPVPPSPLKRLPEFVQVNIINLNRVRPLRLRTDKHLTSLRNFTPQGVPLTQRHRLPTLLLHLQRLQRRMRRPVLAQDLNRHVQQLRRQRRLPPRLVQNLPRVRHRRIPSSRRAAPGPCSAALVCSQAPVQHKDDAGDEDAPEFHIHALPEQDKGRVFGPHAVLNVDDALRRLEARVVGISEAGVDRAAGEIGEMELADLAVEDHVEHVSLDRDVGGAPYIRRRQLRQGAAVLEAEEPWQLSHELPQLHVRLHNLSVVGLFRIPVEGFVMAAETVKEFCKANPLQKIRHGRGLVEWTVDDLLPVDNVHVVCIAGLSHGHLAGQYRNKGDSPVRISEIPPRPAPNLGFHRRLLQQPCLRTRIRGIKIMQPNLLRHGNRLRMQQPRPRRDALQAANHEEDHHDALDARQGRVGRQVRVVDDVEGRGEPPGSLRVCVCRAVKEALAVVEPGPRVRAAAADGQYDHQLANVHRLALLHGVVEAVDGKGEGRRVEYVVEVEDVLDELVQQDVGVCPQGQAYALDDPDLFGQGGRAAGVQHEEGRAGDGADRASPKAILLKPQHVRRHELQLRRRQQRGRQVVPVQSLLRPTAAAEVNPVPREENRMSSSGPGPGPGPERWSIEIARDPADRAVGARRAAVAAQLSDPAQGAGGWPPPRLATHARVVVLF